MNILLTKEPFEHNKKLPVGDGFGLWLCLRRKNLRAFLPHKPKEANEAAAHTQNHKSSVVSNANLL